MINEPLFDSIIDSAEKVIYIIKSGTMKTTLSDGKVSEMSFKTGDIRWNEAVTHNNENIGKTEIHALVIEFKTPMKK